MEWWRKIARWYVVKYTMPKIFDIDSLVSSNLGFIHTLVSYDEYKAIDHTIDTHSTSIDELSKWIQDAAFIIDDKKHVPMLWKSRRHHISNKITDRYFNIINDNEPTLSVRDNVNRFILESKELIDAIYNLDDNGYKEYYLVRYKPILDDIVVVTKALIDVSH